MNKEKRLKAAAPGRPSSRRRRLSRPKSGNVRLVLLCIALLFQVLSFARHTGVSVFGIPIPSGQESGLPIKTDGLKQLDREEVASLVEGSPSALSLPDSSGATARAPRGTGQAPSVGSAYPTGPSSGAGVPGDPALTEPSLPADPQPVAAGGGSAPAAAPGGEAGGGGGSGGTGGGGEGTEGGGTGGGGGGTGDGGSGSGGGGGGGGEVETAENGEGGGGTGEEPAEIETDFKAPEGPLVTSARRGSPLRPVRPIPRLR
jgi:hypothetical protein